MYSDDVYVVFTKAKQLGWIGKIIHKEISHCFLLWNDRGQWFVYDHSINELSVFTVDQPSDIIGQSLVIKTKINQTCWTWGLNTCVSSVKRIIGINDPFILTPYQLLKRIA